MKIRTRFIWATSTERGPVIWFHIGGRKPLAHLPRWKRRLFHLPTVWLRLWPRPFRRHAFPEITEITAGAVEGSEDA